MIFDTHAHYDDKQTSLRFCREFWQRKTAQDRQRI